jgi:hypothetical protein
MFSPFFGHVSVPLLERSKMFTLTQEATARSNHFPINERDVPRKEYTYSSNRQIEIKEFIERDSDCGLSQ